MKIPLEQLLNHARNMDVKIDPPGERHSETMTDVYRLRSQRLYLRHCAEHLPKVLEALKELLVANTKWESARVAMVGEKMEAARNRMMDAEAEAEATLKAASTVELP